MNSDFLSTPELSALKADRISAVFRLIQPQPLIMTDRHHFNWENHLYLTPDQLIELCPIAQIGDSNNSFTVNHISITNNIDRLYQWFWVINFTPNK